MAANAGLQLVGRVLEPVVDDDVAELVLRGKLLARGLKSCLDLLLVVGPAPGGAMKIWTASGIASRICRAPWTSISSTTGWPPAMRPSSSERSVP